MSKKPATQAKPTPATEEGGWDDYNSDEERDEVVEAKAAADDEQPTEELLLDTEREAMNAPAPVEPSGGDEGYAEDDEGGSWNMFEGGEQDDWQEVKVKPHKPIERRPMAPRRAPQQQQPQQPGEKAVPRGPVDSEVARYFARHPTGVAVRQVTRADGALCFGARRMTCLLEGGGPSVVVSLGPGRTMPLRDFVNKFSDMEEKRARAIQAAMPAITAWQSCKG
ncbi:hypothetical protein Pelo_15696 [Pelomyxa schiedti]|nr:hypothetical protein Pelo_15696 [Pelomyxa schiedti]